jgi:hypothetical protein
MNWSKFAKIYAFSAALLAITGVVSFFLFFFLALMNGFAHDAPNSTGIPGASSLLHGYVRVLELWTIPSSFLLRFTGSHSISLPLYAPFFIDGLIWGAILASVIYWISAVKAKRAKNSI